MAGSADVAPVGPSGAGLIRSPGTRYALPVVSVGAAFAAVIVLVTQADDQLLDYGVGLVPVVVPVLTAVLSIAVSVLGLSSRRASSSAGSVLVGALLLLTAWSAVMLPFDLLRMVALVPLPLSGWGLVLRLLLLVSATAALVPALRARGAGKERCAACGRVLPGPLDRVPRWPVVVAVAASLVYPVLRIVWALGGTFGTSGEPLDMDPAVAWGVVVVGSTLVAFTILLLVGRGPQWARALFGMGGLVVGLGLSVLGGLGAIGAATTIAAEGLQSTTSDEELRTWVFVLVYGSWCVAGLGVLAGSWRYWAHRRDDCPACGPLLGS